MPQAVFQKAQPAIPVSEMEIIAANMHTFFLQDRPLFEAVNPQLNQAWGDAFGAAIAALSATPRPQYLVAQLAVVTKDMNIAMRNGQQMLHFFCM